MLIFTKFILGGDLVVAIRSGSCDLIYVQGMIELTQRLLETRTSELRLLGSSLTHGLNSEDS